MELNYISNFKNYNIILNSDVDKICFKSKKYLNNSTCMDFKTCMDIVNGICENRPAGVWANINFYGFDDKDTFDNLFEYVTALRRTCTLTNFRIHTDGRLFDYIDVGQDKQNYEIVYDTNVINYNYLNKMLEGSCDHIMRINYLIDRNNMSRFCDECIDLYKKFKFIQNIKFTLNVSEFWNNDLINILKSQLNKIKDDIECQKFIDIFDDFWNMTLKILVKEYPESNVKLSDIANMYCGGCLNKSITIGPDLNLYYCPYQNSIANLTSLDQDIEFNDFNQIRLIDSTKKCAKCDAYLTCDLSCGTLNDNTVSVFDADCILNYIIYDLCKNIIIDLQEDKAFIESLNHMEILR